MSFRWLGLTMLVAAACSSAESDDERGGSSGRTAAAKTTIVKLGPALDANGEGMVSVELGAAENREVVVELDGYARVVEAALEGAPGRVGSEPASDWIRPRPVRDGRLSITIEGAAATKVTVWGRGSPLPTVLPQKSLTFLERGVVEDKAAVGLTRILAAASDDGHGGRMLDRMLRRFATSAHSERPALASFANAIASQFGGDPSKWKLDDLTFKVTGVHNRLDLPQGDLCGELRVSYASTHPGFAPFHFIVLFSQPAAEDDRAPDGSVHCLGTTRRWSRLSERDGTAYDAALRKLFDASFKKENFLFVETLELTVSPWEWRQWVKIAPDTLDNPVLFQTLDVAQINASGALRTDFLSFVAANAAGLDARTVVLPERFRAASTRVAPGAPRETLDLTGLSADVASKYPVLARNIESIGCPACHTEKAAFVQTSPSRTLSPFYEAELAARAKRLDAMNDTGLVPERRYGPLQQ